jgi:hypothetical protein
MCLRCAAGWEGQGLARRIRLLRLLAIVEHPDALPAEGALRLAREILALTEPDRTGRRCDPVAPPESALEEACY